MADDEKRVGVQVRTSRGVKGRRHHCHVMMSYERVEVKKREPEEKKEPTHWFLFKGSNAVKVKG